jgi:hypothetical protein
MRSNFGIFLLGLIVWTSQVYAHSGGLDSSGCHGGSRPYHCHRSSSDMVGNRLRCDLGSRSSECNQRGGSQNGRSSKPASPANSQPPFATDRPARSTYKFSVSETPPPDTVKRIQKRLKIVGLYTGPVDGFFSPETALALDLYKIKNNLEGNGYFDEETLHYLGVGNEAN